MPVSHNQMLIELVESIFDCKSVIFTVLQINVLVNLVVVVVTITR